jgi:hypothetical protein
MRETALTALGSHAPEIVKEHILTHLPEMDRSERQGVYAFLLRCCPADLAVAEGLQRLRDYKSAGLADAPDFVAFCERFEEVDGN